MKCSESFRLCTFDFFSVLFRRSFSPQTTLSGYTQCHNDSSRDTVSPASAYQLRPLACVPRENHYAAGYIRPGIAGFSLAKWQFSAYRSQMRLWVSGLNIKDKCDGYSDERGRLLTKIHFFPQACYCEDRLGEQKIVNWKTHTAVRKKSAT